MLIRTIRVTVFLHILFYLCILKLLNAEKIQHSGSGNYNSDEEPGETYDDDYAEEPGETYDDDYAEATISPRYEVTKMSRSGALDYKLYSTGDSSEVNDHNTIQNNNTYDDSKDADKPLVTVLIYCVLLTAGTLSSGSILLIFWGHPDIRTSLNTYVTNIAGMDLIIMVLVLPRFLRFLTSILLTEVFMIGTMLTLAAATVDRYFCIKHFRDNPLVPFERRRNSRTAVLLLVIWGVMAFIGLFLYIRSIFISEMSFLQYTITIVLAYIVPFLVIITFFVFYYKDFLRRRSRVTATARHTICLISYILGVFTVYFIFWEILLLMCLFLSGTNLDECYPMHIIHWITYIHSCLVVFVVYFMSSEDWWKYFKMRFCSRFGKQEHKQQETEELELKSGQK